jgi:SH3-like domain-containing protein
MIRSTMPTLAACALLLVACSGASEEKSDTPSGHPVPRWISVRGAPASMRAGPGLDYPILWQFERSGAPLQVVTETEEWRKVCGPDGSMAWIHRSLTTGRRRVIALEGTDLLAEAEAGSEVRARIETGAMISLDTCENGWCRLRSGDIRGWSREAVLFGTATTPLCDPREPATRGNLRLNSGG